MSGAFDDIDILPSEAALGEARAAIEVYNARRPEAEAEIRKNLFLFMPPFAAVCAAYIWLAFPVFSGKGFVSTMVIGIGAALVYGGIKLWEYCHSPGKYLQAFTRDELMPKVFGFVDGVRFQQASAPNFASQIPASAIVRHNRIEYDDLIRGTHHGMAFELSECAYWFKAGKTDSKEFQGVVLNFKLDTPFAGELIISKRQSGFQRFFNGAPADKHLGEFTPENNEVKALHSVRSNNWQHACKLVDGPLAQTLLWLNRTWPDGIARIALKDGDGYLFVPSQKNFFELPDIAISVNYSAHVEPMIRQLAMLLATADLVRKAVMR